MPENHHTMCRYFNKNGWPHSSFLTTPPATDADKDLLIDTLQVIPGIGAGDTWCSHISPPSACPTCSPCSVCLLRQCTFAPTRVTRKPTQKPHLTVCPSFPRVSLCVPPCSHHTCSHHTCSHHTCSHPMCSYQDWKTDKYQQMIGSGQVPVRPGVVELMDEARQRGLLVAVCSAATKSSVIFTLTSLLGKERFERLDCFLAGDDVPKKKPDPTIYKIAAQRLGVPPSSCLVVEDSVIGLQAALGAGMPCVITYTPSTKSQDFNGAVTAFDDLGGVSLDKLITACSAVVA
ncbi:unnamed protein product [Closterium sp. Naga37s-1]|nr:unnamed protein product [Closterium sp. Naga37s-1]